MFRVFLSRAVACAACESLLRALLNFAGNLNFITSIPDGCLLCFVKKQPLVFKLTERKHLLNSSGTWSVQNWAAILCKNDLSFIPYHIVKCTSLKVREAEHTVVAITCVTS